MKEKIKVISYIFRKNGEEVLVFDHRDFPEAGTQVVGGTVEVGEELPKALVREIFEEAGLVILESDCEKIGETVYFRQDYPEKNLRHYFKVSISNLPDRWSHTVHSDGADNDMVFEFFWLSIKDAKKTLVGNFGELL
jgi:8-oxo-dGTP diphosphatase